MYGPRLQPKLPKELRNLFISMKIKEKTKLDYDKLEKKFKKPYGFDNAHTIFFKRMMQTILPINFKSKISLAWISISVA